MMSSSTTSMVSMNSDNRLELMLGWMMERISCTRSGRCTAFSSIFTLPLSIRLMSSTSLMRESRCWLEVEIFFR